MKNAESDFKKEIFEKEGKNQNKNQKPRTESIAGLITGLVAGVLTLIIPFLGHWWELRIGEAFILKLDPFNPEIVIFGKEAFIPLLYWTGFSLKLIVLLSGALLIIGSITSRWWSVHLVKFGSTKLCWIVVATFVSLLALNLGIPGLELPIEIPLNEISTEIVRMENVKITIPIYARLTEAFWIAVFASLLGIYVRFKSK
ncbi:MAG: hypothetical protein H0Z28_11500 [Archaeoglobus sp.]|nr:hypothetical protein [Archaeoglobus sp.]